MNPMVPPLPAAVHSHWPGPPEAILSVLSEIEAHIPVHLAVTSACRTLSQDCRTSAWVRVEAEATA